MGAKEWFERWFGEEYRSLYPHRDDAQAAAQAAALLRALGDSGLSAPSRVLDIGCGEGRHLRAFRESGPVPDSSGLRAFGVDLSAVLLRGARRDGLSVARADMRRLPFADGAFDLVACFFTSFGYFGTPEEDAAALREFARVARPGGALFLDLPNPDAVLGGLVPVEEIDLPGRRVTIARRVEADRVVKRIRILREDPESGAEIEEIHEERVRLHTRGSLGPVLGALGLGVTAVLGDERGSAFDPASSPRMSLLLRRAA